MSDPVTLEKFKPVEEKPLDVEIDVSEPVVTSDQAVEAFKTLGLVKVNAQTINSLKKIGVYLKGHGVLHIQRGQSLVTQQRLDEVMQSLAEMASKMVAKKKPKVKEVTEVSNCMANIAKQLSESQKVTLAIEALLKPTTRREEEIIAQTLNNAFHADEDVRPATNNTVIAKEVHIHQNQKTLAPSNGSN